MDRLPAEIHPAGSIGTRPHSTNIHLENIRSCHIPPVVFHLQVPLSAWASGRVNDKRRAVPAVLEPVDSSTDQGAVERLRGFAVSWREVVGGQHGGDLVTSRIVRPRLTHKCLQV